MTTLTKEIRDICSLLIEGNKEGDIDEYLRESGMSEKTFAKNLEAALAVLDAESDVPSLRRRGWCLLAMREVFRRLMATGDYSAAIRAVEGIAKLSGAYPTKAAIGRIRKEPGADLEDDDPFADLAGIDEIGGSDEKND